MPEKGGHGVFACDMIPEGTVVAVFGGTVVTSEQLEDVPDDLQSLSIQVEDDLFLVSTVIGAGDHVNHSCEPNAGLNGQIAIMAMRDIAIGEEVTFDYAMCDDAPYDEFECSCGAASCRGQVTGNDWQRPELWEKYEGYFSPYIQRKITHLQSENVPLQNTHHG
ncbi:MAG: SET domain-containing protein-lysine N-methyltransferase [Phototrophicaceae bacterium]